MASRAASEGYGHGRYHSKVAGCLCIADSKAMQSIESLPMPNNNQMINESQWENQSLLKSDMVLDGLSVSAHRVLQDDSQTADIMLQEDTD